MTYLWEVPTQGPQKAFMEDRSNRYRGPQGIQLHGPWDTCPIDRSVHYTCFTLPGVEIGVGYEPRQAN